MKTYREFVESRPDRYYHHCWLRLRRHRWEWHAGLTGAMAYATCVSCGYPGPKRVLDRQAYWESEKIIEASRRRP